jgi:hypothetical protein
MACGKHMFITAASAGAAVLVYICGMVCLCMFEAHGGGRHACVTPALAAYGDSRTSAGRHARGRLSIAAAHCAVVLVRLPKEMRHVVRSQRTAEEDCRSYATA